MITDAEIREFADHMWEENADSPTALEVVAIFEVAAQGAPDQALVQIHKYLHGLDSDRLPLLTSSATQIKHTIAAIWDRDRTVYEYNSEKQKEEISP